MRFEYFPQPDPDVEISAELRKRVLSSARKYKRDRQIKKARTAAAIGFLFLAVYLIVQARLSIAPGMPQKPPEIATPKLKPVRPPVPSLDPVFPNTGTTDPYYVRDPLRPFIAPHPDKVNMHNPDGTEEVKDWPDDRQ